MLPQVLADQHQDGGGAGLSLPDGEDAPANLLEFSSVKKSVAISNVAQKKLKKRSRATTVSPESLSTDLRCYFSCEEVFKKDYQLFLHIRLKHRCRGSSKGNQQVVIRISSIWIRIRNFELGIQLKLQPIIDAYLFINGPYFVLISIMIIFLRKKSKIEFSQSQSRY